MILGDIRRGVDVPLQMVHVDTLAVEDQPDEGEVHWQYEMDPLSLPEVTEEPWEPSTTEAKEEEECGQQTSRGPSITSAIKQVEDGQQTVREPSMTGGCVRVEGDTGDDQWQQDTESSGTDTATETDPLLPSTDEDEARGDRPIGSKRADVQRRRDSLHPEAPSIAHDTFPTDETRGKPFPREPGRKSRGGDDDARPFACDVCTKRFKTKSTLRVHSRIHAGGTLFACDLCRECFTTIGRLKLHMATHTSFVCGACDRQFKNRFYLKTHMSEHSAGRTAAGDARDEQFATSGGDA